MPENSLPGSCRSTSDTSKRPSGEATWPALGNRVNGAAYTWTATLINRTGNNISRKKRIDALVLFHSRNRSEVVMEITGDITLVFRYVVFFSASVDRVLLSVAFSALACQLLFAGLRCRPSIAHAGSAES